MSETVYLLLSCIGGMFLGGFFFGGLRWTVHRGLSSARPAMWFFCSYLVRTTVTMAGFYVLADGHWARLIACLLGFILIRSILTRVDRSQDSMAPAQEKTHAIEP